MRLIRHNALLRALHAATLAAVLASPFVAIPPASAEGIPQSPKGWSRKAVIENAQRWVDQRVPYSQKRWWRGYRQDCSGFVSMAWNVHASYPTGMMDQIARPIPKDALLPGDVLLNNSGTGNHVVLFAGWADRMRTRYVGYEQLSSTNRPVRRILPYPYLRHQSRYRPYRFTGLPPKTPRTPAPSTTATPPSPAGATRVGVAPAHDGLSRQLKAAFPALGFAAALGFAWGLAAVDFRPAPRGKHSRRR